MLRVGQHDEFLAAFAVTPAGWDREPIFLIDGVPKLASVKGGIRMHERVDGCAILIHFDPLLTISRTTGQRNKCRFAANFAAIQAEVWFGFSYSPLR